MVGATLVIAKLMKIVCVNTVLCRTVVQLSSEIGGGSEAFVDNLVCYFNSPFNQTLER